MYILILLLLMSSVASCQTLEKGWKGIEPLKTNKASVNKLLGTPEIDDNGYYGYTTDEGFIRVNYSTPPCQENKMGRGEYDVAEGIVLNYIVTVKKGTKLSDLNFKREEFKKDMSDHTNFGSYINEEDGIIISVIMLEKEYVTDIRFRPSKKNAEAFKCSQTQSVDKLKLQ